MAWSDINAEAEKELRMSLRLYEAKVRRIEKAQAGKQHGSPYLELELEGGLDRANPASSRPHSVQAEGLSCRWR